jgi:hypothetical protein
MPRARRRWSKRGTGRGTGVSQPDSYISHPASTAEKLTISKKSETGLFGPVSGASVCDAVTSQADGLARSFYGRGWRPLVHLAPAKRSKGARTQTQPKEQLCDHWQIACTIFIWNCKWKTIKLFSRCVRWSLGCPFPRRRHRSASKCCTVLRAGATG